MRRLIARLVRDTRGATAIEYGLICALIGLVVIAALSATDNSPGAMIDRTMDTLAATFAGQGKVD